MNVKELVFIIFLHFFKLSIIQLLILSLGIKTNCNAIPYLTQQKHLKATKGHNIYIYLAFLHFQVCCKLLIARMQDNLSSLVDVPLAYLSQLQQKKENNVRMFWTTVQRKIPIHQCIIVFYTKQFQHASKFALDVGYLKARLHDLTMTH